MCCDQDHEKIAQDAVQKYKDMQHLYVKPSHAPCYSEG